MMQRKLSEFKPRLTQDTSVEAFLSLDPETLSKKRRAVYDVILDLGVAADWQIQEILRWPINTITPRRNELLRDGYIKACGSNINKHTGKRSKVWCVNGY